MAGTERARERMAGVEPLGRHVFDLGGLGDFTCCGCVSRLVESARLRLGAVDCPKQRLPLQLRHPLQLPLPPSHFPFNPLPLAEPIPQIPVIMQLDRFWIVEPDMLRSPRPGAVRRVKRQMTPRRQLVCIKGRLIPGHHHHAAQRFENPQQLRMLFVRHLVLVQIP